jgi:hypothetical protein
VTAFLDGAITRDEYALRRGRIAEGVAEGSRRLEAVEKALGGAGKTLPAADEVKGLAGLWRAKLLGAVPGDTRDAVEFLVAELVPVRVRFGRYTAGIRWTALGAALRAWSEPWVTTNLPPADGGVVFYWQGESSERRLSAAAPRRGAWKADVLRRAADAALHRLPERDRRIVSLYCGLEDGDPRSWREIGELFGIARRRVGEILDRAVEQIAGPGTAELVGRTTASCVVCGAQVRVRPWDARRFAVHLCGDACLEVFRRRRRREQRLGRSRPGAAGSGEAVRTRRVDGI